MITRRTFLWRSAATLAGCVGQVQSAVAGSVTTDEIGDQVQTLPRGQLPDFAKSVEVRAPYRFAVDRGDDLRYIPCFCGCGRFGHQSNRDCYIKATHPDGTLTFTSHAAT